MPRLCSFMPQTLGRAAGMRSACIWSKLRRMMLFDDAQRAPGIWSRGCVAAAEATGSEQPPREDRPGRCGPGHPEAGSNRLSGIRLSGRGYWASEGMARR